MKQSAFEKELRIWDPWPDNMLTPFPFRFPFKKTDLFDCYGAWIKDKPVMPPELKIGLARNNYDFLVILKWFFLVYYI